MCLLFLTHLSPVPCRPPSLPPQHVKQFLLLSKRRTALITQCLKDSETSKPSFMPRLYINRRLAMEHRDNPALEPSCKNAVFNQVALWRQYLLSLQLQGSPALPPFMSLRCMKA